jgi:hypothetical protein
MKILGQDSNGRIVIDGEDEVVNVHSEIPPDSPCFITNFTFFHDSDIEPYDELIGGQND